MEQIKKNFLKNDFNPVFFTLCFTGPVLAFLLTLWVISALSVGNGEVFLTAQRLREFVAYYDKYMVNEFLEIFLNNYFIILMLVYFTPLVLTLRKLWQRWRGREDEISAFEKGLLYLFPAIFLVRQAVTIALIINSMSASISKNILVTFLGIILPHGLPELVAVSMAGALGMEVTRKVLFSSASGRLVNGRILGLLCLFTALCAFVEVYFTPKIFTILMVATGIN